jgi:ribosomal protein L7Ae-like RNA K-turn-binding protein
MNRFSDLIGMAYRGRNAVIGRDRVRDALHRRQAVHVFVTVDAGGALVDEMEGLCRATGTRLSRWGTREEMGRALGRREVAVVAVTDHGLAGALLASAGPPGETG